MDRDESPVVRVEPATARPTPIIVDLGNRSKKAIRKLKKGRGKLMDEVEDTIEQVRLRLADSEHHQHIVPVIVLYGRKRKRSGLPALPIPSPFSLFGR